MIYNISQKILSRYNYHWGEIMNDNKIRIPKKGSLKGDDGHKTFSIRIKDETVAMLDEIASQSNRSRNELINIFLEYGVANFEIIE